MSVRSDEPVSISVIIVNWNAKEQLALCLQSLREQTFQSFETIVVDNGSSDGSIELMREQFPGVVLVETGANLGFAAAANRGIQRARGTWIATLNNDTVADARWVEALHAAAVSASDEVGMLQSHMTLKDRPDRINSTGLVLFKNATAADRGFGQADHKRVWTDEVFCPTAGAALYRRSMLEQVALPSGIFDADFFMYFEDADLGWRCRLAGWSARYVPGAIVQHAFQGSSRRHGNRFVPLQCRRNRLRALARNASVSLMLRSTPTTLIDLAWIALFCGPRTLFSVGPIVSQAFSQRALVTRLLRRRRVDVERSWLGRQ
jgi:GT2 family glycosyltransferase